MAPISQCVCVFQGDIAAQSLSELIMMYNMATHGMGCEVDTVLICVNGSLSEGSSQSA